MDKDGQNPCQESAISLECWQSGFILYPFAFILYVGGGSYRRRGEADHEHDHVGFSESETRARLFALFQL
jgi:hypothetical protein